MWSTFSNLASHSNKTKDTLFVSKIPDCEQFRHKISHSSWIHWREHIQAVDPAQLNCLTVKQKWTDLKDFRSLTLSLYLSLPISFKLSLFLTSIFICFLNFILYIFGTSRIQIETETHLYWNSW